VNLSHLCFTASAVCSVTDTPPTLLVCMNQSSRSHVHFIKNKILSVNVLGPQHEQISNAFASSKFSSERRFQLGSWTPLKTGSPVLDDCEIENIQQVGTHSIFMCRVVAIQRSEQDQSLAYFNRIYHSVGQVEFA